ncbi:MAG: SH3 domain-containing protein [Synechococcaceae cyanobacterium SM2_3_1]|nr:SH3 domain-containing protein [Synechococcaceae cyanobacterium SM2_3_1]
MHLPLQRSNPHPLPLVPESVRPTPPQPPATATQNAPSPDDTDVSAATAFVPAGERGRVLVPVGLAIRSQPNLDASRVGGVPVNEVITVLQVTADGRWQRIRRQNGQEGWVKAGNLGPE